MLSASHPVILGLLNFVNDCQLFFFFPKDPLAKRQAWRSLLLLCYVWYLLVPWFQLLLKFLYSHTWSCFLVLQCRLVLKFLCSHIWFCLLVPWCHLLLKFLYSHVGSCLLVPWCHLPLKFLSNQIWFCLLIGCHLILLHFFLVNAVCCTLLRHTLPHEQSNGKLFLALSFVTMKLFLMAPILQQ